MKKNTITKEKVEKVLKALEDDFKKALAKLVVANPNPMEWETYEEVCEAEEIDPVQSLPFLNPKSLKEVSTNGVFKLETIFEAFNNRCGSDFNETWEPDFTNKDQKKFSPLWSDYDPSLGRFVYTYTVCTFTWTYLGARLCTDTDAKAIHIRKQYDKEWNEFLNPKL